MPVCLKPSAPGRRISTAPGARGSRWSPSNRENRTSTGDQRTRDREHPSTGAAGSTIDRLAQELPWAVDTSYPLARREWASQRIKFLIEQGFASGFGVHS